MVDTVTFQTRRPLLFSLEQLRRRADRNPGLSVSPCKVYTGNSLSDAHRLVDRNTGMKLSFVDGTVHLVEASLPRLLYRDNSCLLTSRRDIDDALALLRDGVTLYAGESEIPEPFKRVDLTLQFQLGIPASAFIQVFSRLRHPSCRTGVTRYDNGTASTTGVTFKGKTTRITVYDKQLQMRKGPGEVVRFEIRLSGQSLKRHLGTRGGDYPTGLSFGRCYEAFRAVVGAFPQTSYSPPVGHGPRDFITRLLAAAGRVGWEMEDGRPPAELLPSYFGQQTCRRYVRDAAALDFRHVGVAPSDLAPEAWPPPLLAIDPYQRFGGRRTRYPR